LEHPTYAEQTTFLGIARSWSWRWSRTSTSARPTTDRRGRRSIDR